MSKLIYVSDTGFNANFYFHSNPNICTVLTVCLRYFSLSRMPLASFQETNIVLTLCSKNVKQVKAPENSDGCQYFDVMNTFAEDFERRSFHETEMSKIYIPETFTVLVRKTNAILVWHN